MRDRVAWAGGGSLNCGSDWDEDLDMFSRPCNPGGGMTGCCFQASTIQESCTGNRQARGRSCDRYIQVEDYWRSVLVELYGRKSVATSAV